MQNPQTLNKLEHYLLSMQVDAIEPLYVLYSDAKRDIEGANLDLILEALIKLVQTGFSKCYIGNGDLIPCEKLTLRDLQQRFSDLTEEEKTQYPTHGEYFFEITKKGKEEELKEIYSDYYAS